MKKQLLATLGGIALMLTLSPAAHADAFLSITNGVSSISCNNSTSAGVMACTAAGFTTSLGSSQIQIGNATVGGFLITDITLTGNQPGTPAEAHAIDTKTSIQNVSAGATPLVVTFSENNYTLPSGSPLTLSASHAGTFTSGTVTGNGETFTGFGVASNALTPVPAPGAVSATPTPCLQTTPSTPPTASCNASSTPQLFVRSGAFGLQGSESITLATGGIASFNATVAVTPPAAIPEPSSLILLGTGMLLVASRKLRKK